MMKLLEELESKVLNVIKKNKELQEENCLLKLENEELKDKAKNLEASVVDQGNNSQVLEEEKTKIKSSIEELLDSISSLENKNKEITR